jgi:hypothetical protein
VTGGADIAEAHPAVIRTGGMWAKVAGAIDLAATPSGEGHARWRCAGYRRLRPDVLLTQLALRPTNETCKRFGTARGPGQFRLYWSALSVTANPLEQENEKHEENAGERREIQVESHHQPPTQVVNGLIIAYWWASGISRTVALHDQPQSHLAWL